jgi:hemerythrin-like domain-containing protein
MEATVQGAIRALAALRSASADPYRLAGDLLGSAPWHCGQSARCRGVERSGADMTDQQRDVIEVLEHDHREVEAMFAELEALRGASTDDAKARRKELADQATIELVRHSVAEEVLVYPQVERKVSAEEAEHARKEHAEAEETMRKLEKLDADDPAFDDELETLMAEIRHHIEDEEGQMFAHMRQVIDADELRKLGERVENFKKVAPTRPHPSVPNEPLPRIAAGPAASLFDRMRDLATGRGTDDD